MLAQAMRIALFQHILHTGFQGARAGIGRSTAGRSLPSPAIAAKAEKKKGGEKRAHSLARKDG
jgi:hypothetical protein